MCTLVAALRQFEGFPLVVAANRDERLNRAASPPRLWPGDVPFVAPRDEVAGGTWLGLNGVGLFVGITNRFGVPVDASRRSRGQLVTEALAARSARALHEKMSAVTAPDYNPFHLLYADAKDAFVTWYDGSRLEQAELGPGVHVVTERSLGGDDKARTERVRALWPEVVSAAASGPDALAQRLQAMMSAHGADPLSGPCIHLPAFNYGTRSSLVLLEREPLADSRFLWAEGAPCEHPYQDWSPQVSGWLSSSGPSAPQR